VIRQVEPSGVGQPERLGQYLEAFHHRLINDTRLFAFHAQAEQTADGRVRLTGYAEFEENRRVVVEYLRRLGFTRIDDRMEMLPSKALGTRLFGVVRAGHVFCFERPGGEVVTECLLGAPLYLLKQTHDGFLLCHGPEGYVGYIRRQAVECLDRQRFLSYVEGPQVWLREDFALPGSDRMPAGARVKLLQVRDSMVTVMLPDGRKASVPRRGCRIDRREPDPRMARVIQNARRLLGTPYRWGGNTSDGIDCSGLVQVAFGAEGIHWPRDSNQQVYLGTLVAVRWDRSRLRPGDTLYFLGRGGMIRHTALYLGGGRYLEAVRPAVRISSFNPDDAGYHAARAAALAFGKRLLE